MTPYERRRERDRALYEEFRGRGIQVLSASEYAMKGFTR